MTAWYRQWTLAAVCFPMAMLGCKIPPWPDPTEGAVNVNHALESSIPWGKTCILDVHSIAGPQAARTMPRDVVYLRSALEQQLAMVGVFRKIVETGEADYRLTVEVQESTKKTMSVSVMLRESRLEKPVAAFEVTGHSGDPGNPASPVSTAQVTAFWITVPLDFQRTSHSSTATR